MTSSGLLPRHLHPGAWWLWALGLATAASRTTNPLLLALVVAVAGYVVVARRSATPWAGAYGVFLRLGLVIVVIRVLMGAVFGVTQGTTVLFTLPDLPLPGWFSGVRLGGPVTAETAVAALYDGLRLAAVIICVGAANALVTPTRLLRCVPAALYEVGVAVVVALTLAPQLIRSAGRVREARRLRGRAERGFKALRGIAVPVLEGALEHSLELAAAMDSRGYGRRATVHPAVRRAASALTLSGLLGVCAGLYGLLDAGSPPLLGLPLLGLGLALAVDLGAMVGTDCTTGGRGVTTAGTSPTRIPRAGRSGSVGQDSGTTGAISACGFSTPTVIAVAADVTPAATVTHSANAHGSGR